MTQSVSDWRFTDVVCADRAARLYDWPSFDPIILALQFSSVEKFWWEAYRGPALKACNRASFTLRVASAIYDAFFNSPNGYRGQYARAPTIGEAANRKVLNTLEQSLLSAEVARHTNVRPDLIWTSLRAKDAKVWIVEDEVEDQLTDERPAISYPFWERNSLDGQGLRAPVGNFLEVKGGWLDSEGIETRDPSKAHRSLHIFERGYT